jgi:hypothetical protein
MSLRYCFDRFPLILNYVLPSASNEFTRRRKVRTKRICRRSSNEVDANKFQRSLQITFLSESGAHAIRVGNVQLPLAPLFAPASVQLHLKLQTP